MKFHDDAINAAKAEARSVEEQRVAAKKLAEEQLARFTELARRHCKEKLIPWFTEVGMLPAPRYIQRNRNAVQL